MSTEHYVDSQGNYIGGFGDGAQPPEGSTLAPSAPPSGAHTLVSGAWVPPPITEAMVDAEAQRRTDAILPAERRDEISLHGLALLMKGEENWNAADLAAVAEADSYWSQIEPIRLGAATLKAMDPIPQDYATNEAYWT